MPWFQSKPFDGYWGNHWTMSTMNPDDTVDGKAQIASHFYPLIGPYSSNDPKVLEYQSLLMKYTGIDGVIIDWYGVQLLYDYPQLLSSSNLFIQTASKVGLTYAVMYEDRTLAPKTQSDTLLQRQFAQSDMTYLTGHYFNDSNYIHIQGLPLMGVFGPTHVQNSTVWKRIFKGPIQKPFLLPIWGEIDDVGSQGNGEFAWIWNGGSSSQLTNVTNFYSSSSQFFKLGIAYPGFNDFYQQGGWGNGLGWQIQPNNGLTLQSLLTLAKDANISHIQQATWNDYGEGTCIEPTTQFGTNYLEIIQQFTGVPFDEIHLQGIHELYTKRKAFKGDFLKQKQLDQVYYYFISLQPERALDLLAEI
jgi:hypothetical protein